MICRRARIRTIERGLNNSCTEMITRTRDKKTVHGRLLIVRILSTVDVVEKTGFLGGNYGIFNIDEIIESRSGNIICPLLSPIVVILHGINIYMEFSPCIHSLSCEFSARCFYLMFLLLKILIN